MLAVLAGIALALVFTVGKRQGAAKATSSSSVHDGHATAAGDVTATVTPIVEAGGQAKDAAAGHDHAAGSAKSPPTTTTTTAAATTTTTTTPAAAAAVGPVGGQAPTSAASILADALANNPLLSNLGDPLQVGWGYFAGRGALILTEDVVL